MKKISILIILMTVLCSISENTQRSMGDEEVGDGEVKVES